jgi:cytidylate kinase
VRSYVISGLSGSGKTTAGEYAERLGYDTVSVGETVRQAYDERSHSESVGEFVLRTHERNGRAAFVREALAELDQRPVRRNDATAGVVVEGVHNMTSVRAVRDRFGLTPVVWIRTPLSLRFRRCRQREERHTPVGLLDRDLRELNSGMSDLAAPFGHDYHVLNDGSRQVLEERLAAILE